MTSVVGGSSPRGSPILGRKNKATNVNAMYKRDRKTGADLGKMFTDLLQNEGASS